MPYSPSGSSCRVQPARAAGGLARSAAEGVGAGFTTCAFIRSSVSSTGTERAHGGRRARDRDGRRHPDRAPGGRQDRPARGEPGRAAGDRRHPAKRGSSQRGEFRARPTDTSYVDLGYFGVVDRGFETGTTTPRRAEGFEKGRSIHIEQGRIMH